MRLTLHTFLTLDGVMQAPGGPGEDDEGGFAHGGWSFPYGDAEELAAIVDWFAGAEAFLFGRKTYEIFSSFWPHAPVQDDPVAAGLNRLPKYVASTRLPAVDWHNASLIEGDVVAEVRRLKEQPGGELQVHGSGGLAQTLIENDLVDEYRLLVFPVHLGAGKKLFRDGVRAGALRLLSSRTTSTGVLIAVYEPAGPPQYGSYADE